MRKTASSPPLWGKFLKASARGRSSCFKTLASALQMIEADYRPVFFRVIFKERR